MNPRFLTYSVPVTAMLGIVMLLSASINAAQNRASASNPASAKPTPRMSDGHPDFSGFYNGDTRNADPNEEAPGEHVINRTNDGNIFFDYAGANYYAGETQQSANQPSYKPEYMAKAKAIGDISYGIISSLDPNLDCKPDGVPRASLGIMQVVQNEKYLAIL
jgi:hypothetical protein